MSLPVKIISKDEDLLPEFISEIKSSPLISLDCEGVDLSRTGQICIIQLSTRNLCFLFDVHNKNTNSQIIIFLKEVLEDYGCKKIIHDCKMDADALFHILNIKLVGVHDTQVFDSVLSGYNRELNLNRTLIANGCMPNQERDNNVYNYNKKFWATRPMTQTMIEWASGQGWQ